jgi:hypothetical protein
MEQIYNLSDFIKVSFFVAVSCLTAALFYHFLKFVLGKRDLPSDSYFGINIIGTMTSLCSVLLVFVLIQAISTNVKINSIVSEQLSEMYKFEKHLMLMSKKDVSAIKPYFSAYLDSIIYAEWKLMGLKQQSVETEEKFNEFLMSVSGTFDKELEENVAAERFSMLTDGLIKFRYLKLRTKASSLPPELYAGIVFLLMLNVLQFFLLSKRNNYSLSILLLHVAAQGLILGLIFVYDHPFYGDRGVKAEAYLDVKQKLAAIEGK